MIAVLGSALVSIVAWSVRPRHLEPPVDIVGYPAWADVDFEPVFRAYRLAMWQFPLTAAALFGVLTLIASRRGWTTADASRLNRSRIAGLTAGTVEVTRPPVLPTLGAIGRLLPVAALVAIVASSTGDDPARHLDAGGFLAAAGYVALLCVGALVSAQLQAGRVSPASFRDNLALINVMTAPMLISMCAWQFANATSTVSAVGDRSWSWIPLWLALLVGLAVTAALANGLRQRRRPADLESLVVTFGAGSVLVFVTTCLMVGSVGSVSGFDDMMSIVGAEQVRDGGFPWRDVLMIHGLFEDSLRSLVGFELFGHSMWGSQAAYFTLWKPLGWVGVYVLTLWAARRHGLVAAALFLSVVLIAVQVHLPARWVMAAPVFLLLGVALRRDSLRWVSALTVALFIEAVLVPEASFQVMAVAAVLLLSDLRERWTVRPVWRVPHRFATFVVTGAICSVVLACYLALHGALDDFVRYYVIFGPGHVASGFLPIGPYATTSMIVAYVSFMALVGATLCWAVYRAFRPEPVSAEEWLLLATALFAALYGEKALGRFDTPHLEQSIAMAVPLLLLWAAVLLPRLDDALRDVIARPLPAIRRGALGSIVSLALVVLVLALRPAVTSAVWHSPSHNIAVVSDRELPLLGFTVAPTADVDTISDLRKVVEVLGGRDASVFDFSNSPGIFYYLMGLTSPTPYYHVSMAIPEAAQRFVIDDLEKKRPAIVVFDASRFGLSTWDSVTNPVRHSLISRYLLDGWTPVVRSHGALFMLRNDLVPGGPIGFLGLTQPADTEGLHSSTPACDWGYVPNFLPTSASGDREQVVVTPPTHARQYTYSGWAWNGAGEGRVERVVVASGAKVVATLPPSPARWDVAAALNDPAAASAGFRGSVATAVRGPVKAYAILANGVARPVARAARTPPSSLALGDGTTVPVVNNPVSGSIEDRGHVRVRLSEIVIPPGDTFPGHALATFGSSTGPIGRSTVTLYDSENAADSGGSVLFRVLPLAGRSVNVRVGSCLQWHGYGGQRIVLAQRGGRPIDTVTLSDFESD